MATIVEIIHNHPLWQLKLELDELEKSSALFQFAEEAKQFQMELIEPVADFMRLIESIANEHARIKALLVFDVLSSLPSPP